MEREENARFRTQFKQGNQSLDQNICRVGNTQNSLYIKVLTLINIAHLPFIYNIIEFRRNNQMEELFELKDLLLAGHIDDALLLVEELTEMSKDDKLNKIYSFGIIVLLHLIKQQAEKRTTRSWETSIANAVRQIQRTNKRRKAGGHYLKPAELRETLEDAYASALRQAAIEAFEGRYEAEELAEMVNKTNIIDQAMDLIYN